MTEDSKAEFPRPWWATQSEPSEKESKANFSRPSWAKRFDGDDEIPTPGVISQVVVGSLEDIAAARAAGLTFTPHRQSLHQLAELLIFDHNGEIDLETGFRILMEMAATYPVYEAKGKAKRDYGPPAGCDDPNIILNVLAERYGADVLRLMVAGVKP